MLSVFLTFVLSMPPEVPPVVVVGPAQVPAVRPLPAKEISYEEAADCAAKTNRPLIVFVGVKARPISGYVVCSTHSCFNSSNARIILATPANGELHWLADLPISATDTDIRNKIENRFYSPLPVREPSFFMPPARSSGRSC